MPVEAITGHKELIANLDKLDKKVRKKTLKKAVDGGAKVVLWSAKSKVRRVSGLLYKSLGRKSKTYRNSGVAVAIVGPRTGFKVTKVDGKTIRTATKFGLVVAGKFTKKGLQVIQSPSAYSHLVEKGTRRSRAFPFLRPAVDENKGKVADVMATTMRAAIEEV